MSTNAFHVFAFEEVDSGFKLCCLSYMFMYIPRIIPRDFFPSREGVATFVYIPREPRRTHFIPSGPPPLQQAASEL